MNKSKIRRVIALGTLLAIGSLSLWNCETEEALPSEIQTHQTTTQNFQRHVVPLLSLELEHPQAFQILSKLSKESLDPTLRNQENYSEEYDLHYSLDKVYVLEGNDYEQFSFVVRTSDQPENQFMNYVLYVYSNNEYQQFLISYEYDTPAKESFHPALVVELEGSQLLTRSIINC